MRILSRWACRHAHRLPRLRLRVCPAMLRVAPALALRLLRPCPRSRPRDFWAVSQEVGADFAMGLDFCAVFGGGSFAVGSADLGKRRRRTAFRADLACETAQKLRAGFACDGSCAS